MPRPRKILHIEDCEIDAALISLEFARSPEIDVATLTHAPTARDALVSLRNERYDAILLDIGLPDSTGTETLDVVLQHSAGAPVLILTGYDDEILTTTALQKGAQDVLIKNRLKQGSVVRSLNRSFDHNKDVRMLTAQRDVFETATNQFETLLNDVGDALFVVDADMTIRYVNRHGEQLLNMVKPGVFLHSLFDLIPHQNTTTAQTSFERDNGSVMNARVKLTPTSWSGRAAMMIAVELSDVEPRLDHGLANIEQKSAQSFDAANVVDASSLFLSRRP
jgi:CheY-like chemotaxis protein